MTTKYLLLYKTIISMEFENYCANWNIEQNKKYPRQDHTH